MLTDLLIVFMYKAKGWGFKKVLPLKLTVGKWEAMSF